jgi:hypothetical protein
MDNQANTRTKAKKPSLRQKLEPISYEEIMGNAGMSGFVSFLDAPRPEAETREAVSAPALPEVGREADTAFSNDTVQDNNTVQQTTVQQSKTVKDSDTVQQNAGREGRRWRVKRAVAVEDGHSLAEQEVYRTLWRVGAPENDGPEANRLARIGYDRLATLVRLSWVTVKANLRSLEKKLAIEVVGAEDSANREGKRYRVYSPEAIMARRKSAGLLWVRRTRGVELLNDGKGD